MVFGLFKKSSNEEVVTTYGDVVVVSLQKSAYYADSRDELLKTVQGAVEQSPSSKVVIDMSKVKQFTSGPLGALVVSARKAEDGNGQLVIAAAVSNFVGKVLSTATEAKKSPSFPNVRGALAALSTEAASAYDKAQS
ncbi:MAG: STAS domain-containing protein [Pseudomonadota bacterium]